MYLTSTYSFLTVVASLFIASFASYVALDLAKRVRSVDRRAAACWWAGGSIAMGTGIWSMHFVGMLAFSLPISLGYTHGWTSASWLAGVAASAVALGVAAQPVLTRLRLGMGALAMGGGIGAMHYMGMAALDMTLPIEWNARWVGISLVLAVGASAAALLIFAWLRELPPKRATLFQGMAAVLMGLAITGMHYTGMEAAGFPAGTFCLSAHAFGGGQVGGLVLLSSTVLLGVTLFTSLLDARLQARESDLLSSLATATAQLQSADAELRHRALSDPLTGLANRLLFEDRLAQALARAERSGDRSGERGACRPAVLCVNLDGFKAVNDSFGHARGDQLLLETASRLRANVREIDTVARIGGDEFLVLTEEVGALADNVQLARRVVEALKQPFELAGRVVQVSGSVGIALHRDGDTAHNDKLVTHAEAALDAAKHAGGATYVVFEAHMTKDALEQLSLQGDLRQAIERGELELHYQPKIDAKSRRIRGVEALLRWRHPVRGMVGPGVFIPIAERFGLIGAIGDWVIEESCRQIAAWADQGMRMRVAINLSVHQLRDQHLVPRIVEALHRHQVDGSRLLCEITESVAMEDIQCSQAAFAGLAEAGIFLSIDDFGTGYSSLSYLRQLPAQQLKIDRSFVRDIEASQDARAIVSAVIQLAHALALRVVAEGVETAAQEKILVALGCDELQGYLFGRPMPAAALTRWAEGDSPEGGPAFSPSVMEAVLVPG